MFHEDFMHYAFKDAGFFITDLFYNIRPNFYNRFGIKSCCRLPIRTFSNNLSVKQSTPIIFNVTLNNAKGNSNVLSLTNLINKSIKNRGNNKKMDEHKKFLHAFLIKTATNITKIGDIELSHSVNIKDSKFSTTSKCDLNKTKKIKTKHDIIRIGDSKNSNQLLKQLFSYSYLKKSLINESNKKKSINLVKNKSYSNKLTKVTSNIILKPIQRQRFLIEEKEDTLYGIEENLFTETQTFQSNKKCSTISSTFYVSVDDSKTMYPSTDRHLTPFLNENTEKKSFLSVYEKPYPKTKPLHPTALKLMINSESQIETLRTSPSLKSKPLPINNCVSNGNKPITREFINKKLVYSQRNNSNNEEDDKDIDNHEYFRHAQQLISNNSSQMEYLISGHEKTKSAAAKKVDIRPFKDGKRTESPENINHLKSKLYSNMQSTNKSGSKTSQLPFQDIMNDNLSKPDIKAIMNIDDETVKRQPGPALQGFLERRQKSKRESQANDHNLMLSRARMVKYDSLQSEFEGYSEDRERVVDSSDHEINSKTNKLIKYYENNDRMISRNYRSSSESVSESDSNSIKSGKTWNKSPQYDTNSDSEIFKISKFNENSQDESSSRNSKENSSSRCTNHETDSIKTSQNKTKPGAKSAKTCGGIYKKLNLKNSKNTEIENHSEQKEKSLKPQKSKKFQIKKSTSEININDNQIHKSPSIQESDDFESNFEDNFEEGCNSNLSKASKTKSSITSKIKCVQFNEPDNVSDVLQTHKEDNRDSFNCVDFKEKAFIFEKLEVAEQGILTLTMMVHNVIQRMQNIELSFQQFSENFLKIHQETQTARPRFHIQDPYRHFQPNYHQMNNLMLQSISYWNNGC